jgi:mRNA interferase MazF
MQTKPKQGEIVLVPFPFSDLSYVKTRPALVLSRSKLNGDDVILCPISSQKSAFHTISISNDDLVTGELPMLSYVRFSKLITVDKNIIHKSVSVLSTAKLRQIIDSIKSLL